MAIVANRYELVDVIGSGGMATVWTARDTELGRIVALKRPHPAAADSDLHTRFRREARIAATVSHPNLVTVFDVGADDDGPFLTMEYVDAPSLAETTVPPENVGRVGREICSGLAALHLAGIIHRDVKPANVLLGDSGAQLTDFGIARSNDDTAALTQAGSTFTTPAYAAPEVVASGTHSEASDVYSLGAMLFEMVAGRRAAPNTDTQVFITDPYWRPILEAAMHVDPATRPSASELLDLLSGSGDAQRAETTIIAVADAPVPVDASVPVDDRIVTTALPMANRDLEPMERNRQRLMWLLGSAAAACVALVLFAIVRSDDDPALVDAGGSTTVVSEPDPAEPDAVVDPVAVAADEEPAPTEPPAADPLYAVAVAREDLTSFIDAIRGASLSDKDADSLLKDIDKAITAVAENDKKTENEFVDALKRIDKDIEDSDDRAEAERLLAALVTALDRELIEL